METAVIESPLETQQIAASVSLPHRFTSENAREMQLKAAQAKINKRLASKLPQNDSANDSLKELNQEVVAQIRTIDELMSVIILNHPLSAVYILKKSGKAVYVGQSVNSLARINNHKGKDFDEIELQPMAVSLLESAESRLIAELNPPLNQTKGKGGSLNCYSCGNEWISRTQNPKCCPACKSYTWQKPE